MAVNAKYCNVRRGSTGIASEPLLAPRLHLLRHQQLGVVMCLTCGCMDAHKEMGAQNITFEDLKAAADENGRSVTDTLDIWQRTLAKDQGDHSQEYATQP